MMKQAHGYDDLVSLRTAAGECLTALRHAGEREISLLGRKFLLSRHQDDLYLCSEMKISQRPDDLLLLRVCGLALPNIRHFPAVVAFSSESGCLKFIRKVRQHSTSFVLQSIEQMFNQMDVWQRLLEEAPTTSTTRQGWQR